MMSGDVEAPPVIVIRQMCRVDGSPMPPMIEHRAEED